MKQGPDSGSAASRPVRTRAHEVALETDSRRPEPIEAGHAREPGNWIARILLVFVTVWIAHALITNPGFEWDVVGEYLFAPEILTGTAVTAQLVALSMFIAIVLGIVLGVMRLSHNSAAYLASSAYVWFFRGTPVLVQLIFWYNIATLYPQFTLGIPFGGPDFVSVESNRVMTSFTAAVIGLSLNEAAYYAEIVRAGILSVDRGQTVAARALGFTPVQVIRRIVLPQAMRAIVPPTGNQIIAMLKYSALASVIAVPELLHSAQSIYNRTFGTIPLLIVASIWYLVLVTVLSIGQRYVERYFSRGHLDDGQDRFAALKRRMPILRKL
ncbi:amino acid ABC transporter permease [Streptomyces sp. NPDC008343]|uniref:amino acid ABC transporter permease n=1 Tax=Streptomyces sp. NPDC008343 TaxID=3364828 RepID=UPI0036ED38E0